MQVHFSETANLTYQLDAVAGDLESKAPSDYKSLWQSEFLRTEKDRAMVRRWAALKERYNGSVELPAVDLALERSNSWITLSDQIRIAGLRSENHEEFLDRASLLMTPGDAVRLGEVIHHFAPAFRAWWRKEPARAGKGFVGSVRNLLARPATQKSVDQFRHFYGSSIPDGSTVHFSLLYRPNRVKGPTSGRQMGNVGSVEFLPGEKAEQRLDVVLHEFCHFLYESRPDDANQALQNRFFAVGDPASKPAFNLLNEAMASAFGNGVITRQFTPADRWQSYLARPLSFYNNPSIDRAAKRVLRLIDEWIPKGRTMDDPEFARIYVSALKDAFGPDLTRPALYLSAAFIHVDGKFGRDYLRTLRNALGVASAYSQVTNEITEDTLKDYRSQPNLSAVFAVPPARLDALVAQGVLLSADAERIRTEVASKGSAIFSRPRSAVAYSFVIVTDDLVEAEKRGRQLAGAAEIFEGILG